MSNTSRPTGGNSLDARIQNRQKAKDEAEARRRREAEKFAVKAWWRRQTEITLGHANAIAGGSSPPSPHDAADFLMLLHTRLADDGLLRWLDRMEEMNPNRRFVLGAIREATPAGREAIDRRLQTVLTDSDGWYEFWSEVNLVVTEVWDWLQENVPEARPVAPPAEAPVATPAVEAAPQTVTPAALPAKPTQKDLQQAGYEIATNLAGLWKPLFGSYKRFSTFLDDRADWVPNVSLGRKRFVNTASLASLVAILPKPVSGMDMTAGQIDAFLEEERLRKEAAARIREENLQKMRDGK